MAEGKPEWVDYAEFWKNTLAGVSLTFAILPTIAYGLRVYASNMVSRKVRADDYLMGIAVVLMWGNTASVCLKAFNGIGVPNDQLSHGDQLRLNLGSWLIVKFWASSMACVKVSILLFLNHLLGTTKAMRITLLVVGICCVSWACVPFFYTIFFCDPISYYWDKSIEGGWCVDNDLYITESIAVGVLSLVTDLVILAIPMPSVWNLNIKTKQKVAVTSILCVGGVVCVFSLLRCIQFAYFDTKNLSTSSNLQSLWTILENDFSILCGCMPQLKPIFVKMTGDSTNNSKSAGYVNSYNNPQSAHGQGFQKMSGVRTMVSGTHGFRSRSEVEDGRNSSEVELKGIEVHTTINHEISQGNRAEPDDRSHSSVGGRAL